MPTRRRLAATWTAAALLTLTAVNLMVLTGPGADAATEPHAVHRAGVVLPHLLAAGMLTVAVTMMTPTALFIWRRRQFRRVLIAEGA